MSNALLKLRRDVCTIVEAYIDPDAEDECADDYMEMVCDAVAMYKHLTEPKQLELDLYVKGKQELHHDALQRYVEAAQRDNWEILV